RSRFLPRLCRPAHLTPEGEILPGQTPSSSSIGDTRHHPAPPANRRHSVNKFLPIRQSCLIFAGRRCAACLSAPNQILCHRKQGEKPLPFISDKVNEDRLKASIYFVALLREIRSCLAVCALLKLPAAHLCKSFRIVGVESGVCGIIGSVQIRCYLWRFPFPVSHSRAPETPFRSRIQCGEYAICLLSVRLRIVMAVPMRAATQLNRFHRNDCSRRHPVVPGALRRRSPHHPICRPLSSCIANRGLLSSRPMPSQAALVD